MSAEPKISNINTHVVDILGSTKGRDQPIMKMDKAVELVKCLGEEVLTSDEYVFFDPFCKAGEILLATALMSTLYRKGKKLIDQKEVVEELYRSKRYFALAPDERHFYLSRRTFYGNERSHSEKDIQNIQNGGYLSEEDGRLDKKKFEKELDKMLEYIKKQSGGKKVIAVGNPPYQEEDGGHDKSANPIYDIFVEHLIDSGKVERICLVIPSRWFSGGRNQLEKFRKKIITTGGIRSIRYFENPHHVFPTVEIRGGVCFFYWINQRNTQMIMNDGVDKVSVKLDSNDLIIPHVKAYPILEKIKKKKLCPMSNVVWSSRPFGLRGYHFERNKEEKLRNPVACICKGHKVNKISRDLIVKNDDKIDEYQVVFPEAGGGGQGKREKVLDKPDKIFILNKGEIATETFVIANSFKTFKEAKRLRVYLQTYFARFLWGIGKPTHHSSAKTFKYVPIVDNSIEWTDEKLFDYFGITREEEKYIRDKVDYWTA